MAGGLFAVSVIGKDRPGIVAGVAEALFDLGCNLEDVTSTILRGHFAMMLIVGAPGGVDAELLEERLADVGTRLGLTIAARTVDETDATFAPPTHTVSVYGADKPGIVFRAAQRLASLGVNITDLQSRVVGPAPDPLYALVMEVVVPEGVDLDDELASLRTDLGVDVAVNAIAAEIL